MSELGDALGNELSGIADDRKPGVMSLQDLLNKASGAQG